MTKTIRGKRCIECGAEYFPKAVYKGNYCPAHRDVDRSQWTTA